MAPQGSGGIGVTVFVVVGSVGLAILVVSLLFGDLLDGLFEAAHFDLGDGLLSTPVIGAFMAAFGFAGALLLRGLETSPVVATGGAVGAGVVMGSGTIWLLRMLVNMPTDATPRTADLVGSLATVVTRIPEDGYGEVLLTASGQRTKLNAKAEGEIAAGTTVVVVQVASSTSVIVAESGF